MPFKNVRSDKEISEVENEAYEGQDSGSKYPGMSYEQGITDTLEWLRGDRAESPFEEN